jgi:ribonuclease HII
MDARACMTNVPELRLEQDLWRSGVKFIGGVDEAGRGALAGPVMAGVVILPNDPKIGLTLSGVRDSKQMTARQRSLWAARIKSMALAWAVGSASAAEIDENGILPATRTAVQRAIQSIAIMPEYLLMDYIHWPGLKNPHLMMPKGEWRSLSVAAASVLAKTERDAVLISLAERYTGYGFARHKGYGTAAHRAAIQTMGYCPEHRRSYVIHSQITQI